MWVVDIMLSHLPLLRFLFVALIIIIVVVVITDLEGTLV